MTHDPLCEATDTSRWWESCYCDIIDKVRQDERDSIGAVRLRTAFNEQGYRDGQRDMLAACLAAVEHDDSCWALRDGDVLDERDCNCYYSLIIERLRTVVTSTGAPTDPLLYRIDYDNASVRASVPIVDFNTTGTEVEHVDTCRVYNCGGCEEIKGDSDE